MIDANELAETDSAIENQPISKEMNFQAPNRPSKSIFVTSHEAIEWMTQQLTNFDAQPLAEINYEETMDRAVSFARRVMDPKLLQMGEMMHSVNPARVAEFARQCSTAAANYSSVEEEIGHPTDRDRHPTDSSLVTTQIHKQSKRPYPRKQSAREKVGSQKPPMPLSETTLSIHANSAETLHTGLGMNGRELLDFIAEANRRGAIALRRQEALKRKSSAPAAYSLHALNTTPIATAGTSIPFAVSPTATPTAVIAPKSRRIIAPLSSTIDHEGFVHRVKGQKTSITPDEPTTQMFGSTPQAGQSFDPVRTDKPKK